MNTNILATIWPASLNLLSELQEKWVNRFRLNLSHWDLDFHKNVIWKIKKLWEYNEVVLDTKWPDIRTWIISWEQEILEWNEYIFILSSDEKEFSNLENKIFHDYEKFYKTVEKWDKIILDSWKIIFRVEKISDDWKKIFSIAENSWKNSSRRHINLPWKHIDLPILTESDREIISMWIKNWIDSVAVSFVRNKHDILEVRNFVWEEIKIISKIENIEWLENIDEIIEFSDEIMFARWDLWIEVDFYRLPILQKKIVKKCNRTLTPIIIATQMLMSMTENISPTRAEVFDVSGAVTMWANTVMLSDETASWKYPVEAVDVMKKITDFAEKSENFIFNCEV